jgi:hypothetical protein
MKPYVLTLARWLAKKAVKAEMRAMGRRPERTEASEIAEATNVYFIEHRNELMKEARESILLRGSIGTRNG